MAEKLQFIDINASGAGMVAAAFDNQVAYCTASGASVTERVLSRDAIGTGTPGAAIEGSRPAAARSGSASAAPPPRVAPLRLAKTAPES